MRILALDLGTRMGMAWNYGLLPSACTLTLATPGEITRWGKQRLDRRLDPRVPRLFKALREFDAPEIVVFEDVQFSTYIKQTQLWASFRTAVWMAFAERADFIECVPVTTLKKFATGNGGADKAEMRKALFTRFPQTKPDLDDNAVDALWVLKWAETNLGRLTA